MSECGTCFSEYTLRPARVVVTPQTDSCGARLGVTADIDRTEAIIEPMLPRFLVPGLDPDRAEAVLPPGEAHHLTRVLRLRVGDDVGVFDGTGHEYRARVASIEGSTVTVTLIAPCESVPGPAVRLTLVQSVLKADPMDDVIRDATMVGVDRIQPVVSARTTVKTAVLSKGVQRWRRIALASTKQCGRSMLPDIKDVVEYPAWLRTKGDAPAFLLVEPSAEAPDVLRLRDLVQRRNPGRAAIVVGPEGGWTAEELALSVESGCIPLSLGRLTLRADAVPLAAAAVLIAVWDQ